MTELKADRAEEEAREIVQRYGPLAVAKMRPADDSRSTISIFAHSIGRLNDEATEAIAAALRSRDTQLAEARERIRALEDAIEHVRAIIVDGSLTGFNCLNGDWAERLYASQGLTANLLGPERVRAARARTILSPATEPPEVDQPNECHQRCFHCGDYADECQCDGGLL